MEEDGVGAQSTRRASMVRGANTGRSYAAAVIAVGVVALVAAGGIAAGTAGASCPPSSLTKPFLPWNDQRQYFLGPDGSMESTAAWALSGGAGRIEGNETFYVNSSADRSSLALPSGSSARTASMCVTIFSPSLRLFVRNTGSPASALRIEVLFRDRFGVNRAATVAMLAGGSQWKLSPKVFFINYIAPLLAGGETTWVSFRFSPTGFGGKWQIDDLYVDPLKMG
jgi:hypothetical protein